MASSTRAKKDRINKNAEDLNMDKNSSNASKATNDISAEMLDKRTISSFQSNEEKEEYVLKACDELVQNNDYQTLLSLLTNLPGIWDSLSTARLTKIVKQVFSRIDANFRIFENLHVLLKGLIECYSDKKMLKLDLECKLINLYLTVGKYRECLESISHVLKELKKYDDKINLISLYVYESRAYYELQDFSRAKSSLTSARALAVSSACPAQLQAQIDLLNGMYLSDEKSFDTAISYFMEALEGFLQDKVPENACVTLRYIILNKILLSKFDDINAVLSSKHSAPFRDDQFIKLLCSVSKSCKKRDLNMYSEILTNNAVVLESDAYATRHLFHLYNILLDQNILKIVEPYSHVKIEFISNKIHLSEDVVENKLRMMILDKTIDGILDHDTQCLIVNDLKNAEDNFAFKNLKIIREFFSEV
ncbi:uncharacterized protein VICG_01773 [Vittaforma corneae ATCC 50505]|uniref:PCI domain-containing protein n=1 Tax=Vittaforma corneae (strain ATCC 50505) TaxID=993615 RepID=L2GKN0_VITCO|nr:uncharacterized protein VICG_01773 [Vittaforma corneae ATCC 50505]ELA41174.1 hypothetical protein VICG_01773 [Vittaforma corneae ATCC 50505]